MKIIKYISVLLCLALTFTLLSACQAKPTESSTEVDNRTLIVELGAIDVEGLVRITDDSPTKYNTIFISNSLTKAMNDYKGQDAWFRILAHFENFDDYYNAGREYNDVLAEELQYAEQIGVMNIEKAENESIPGFYEGYLYCMEATADMIEQLLARKSAQLTLGLPEHEDN